MLFSSIPGHSLLKERLADMANAGRTPHSLLFWGDWGVGALPLALALAQLMVCKAKENGDACGKCPPCNKMQKLIHPDLHFAIPVNSVKPSDRNPVTDLYISKWRETLIANPFLSEFDWYEALGIDNKSGNISVHEADAIQKKLSLKPYEGEVKFMIVWLPEKMNIQASNTILKILEEPPLGTHFFLVSEHPELLLSTIRSRCQAIRVNPISQEELAPALSKDLYISHQEALTLARHANGSYGKARAVSNRSEQQEELIKYASDLMTLCVDKKLLSLIEWADDVAGLGREQQRQMVAYTLDLLREVHVEHLHARHISNALASDLPHLGAWASNRPPHFFSQAVEALNGALSDIDRNVNAKMTFYSTALRLFFAS
jgi:DNA polymerase-3 subunit delta'